MADATPYTVCITKEQDGQPIRGVSHDEAVEAASLVSPEPERTEVVDPGSSHWSVWLPDYMTRYAWTDGLLLVVQTGGYRLEIDMDPA